MGPDSAALIYDADCPVCRKTVDWVRRRAADPDAFEFLPCRSPETRLRFPSIAEENCMRAVHLVLPSGTILAGDRALPEILRRLRRYRAVAPLFRAPGGAAVSRLLYNAFARHRRRFG
jgi:predicted DCC family thiol-disulfide oxidoreductase YuxK